MFLAGDFPISGGGVETGVAHVFLESDDTGDGLRMLQDPGSTPKTVSPCLLMTKRSINRSFMAISLWHGPLKQLVQLQ
jgi:hypothetical protein